MTVEKVATPEEDYSKTAHTEAMPVRSNNSDTEVAQVKKPWYYVFLEMGSAPQIILAALLALAIALPISLNVKKVPEWAITICLIPGDLWLRALKAIVLPLIITAMILAIYRLRVMSRGAKKLAMWTIGYYVMTTLMAIVVSCIMVSQVWGPRFEVADSDQRALDKEADYYKKADESPEIWDAVLILFQSFVPDNIARALAENELLAVLMTSIVVGCLIDGEDSSILRAARELERMVTRIITIIIKLTAFGVFSLILSNLMKLDPEIVGKSLAILIGGTLSTMAIHLFVLVPILFFSLTRMNPYTYWIKNSKAWVTAWGSASSAATLPLTLQCAKDRGISKTVRTFAIPLGCLVNMDGTAIYFPIVVVFLAHTQGIELGPVDYVIITFAATLSSIGTTPIPSSSLTLSIMIAGLVGVPITGMMGVIFAIDWFLDRFRTALNVSGDLFGAMVVQKQTGIVDLNEEEEDELATPGEEDRVLPQHERV